MWLNLALIAPLLIATPFIAPGKSMCQQFERMCDQVLHGTRFNAYHSDTAHNSMRIWARSKWALKRHVTLQPGDIVYWAGTSWNPAGHVGIVGYNGLLLENSTVHFPGKYLGKGARILKDVRPYSLAVRLPAVWVPMLPPGALLRADGRRVDAKKAIRGLGGVA